MVDIVRYNPVLNNTKLKLMTFDGLDIDDELDKYSEIDDKYLSAKDRDIVKVYQAHLDKVQLIDLKATLCGGGVFFDQRDKEEFTIPNLAVASADARSVTISNSKKDKTKYKYSSTGFELSTNMKCSIYRLTKVKVSTPFIPARVKNKIGEESIGNFLVLWEVMNNDISHKRGEFLRRRCYSCGDPALLKHIAGDVYEVIETWELTPLEKSAIGG